MVWVGEGREGGGGWTTTVEGSLVTPNPLTSETQHLPLPWVQCFSRVSCVCVLFLCVCAIFFLPGVLERVCLCECRVCVCDEGEGGGKII